MLMRLQADVSASAMKQAREAITACIAAATGALKGKGGKAYIGLSEISVKHVNGTALYFIKDPFCGNWSAEARNDKIVRIGLDENPLSAMSNRCGIAGIYFPSVDWMPDEKALAISLQLRSLFGVTPQRDRYRDRGEAYLAGAAPGETCFDQCGFHEAEAFLVYETFGSDTERFTSLEEAMAHIWITGLATGL